MINEMNTLYKLDTDNRVRVWHIDVEDDKYRVVSGLQDGKLVESEWKTAKPKNEGKLNETTGPEQAIKEAEALYKKQSNQGGYVDDIQNIHEETYFEPMLAEKYKDRVKVITAAFDRGETVYVSPKLDGFRNCQIRTGMYSRNGKPFLSSPHISFALIDFFEQFPNIVLDGELYNHDLHDNFNKLQSLITKKKPEKADLEETAGKVQYHIYDIFDKKNPNAKFDARLSLLQQLAVQYFNDVEIKLVEQVPCTSFEEIDKAYGHFLEEHYEGIVIRLNTAYENKRTVNLIKRKEFFDSEYEIVDIVSGQGNWSGCAKSLLFRLRGDITFSAGIKGSQEEMRTLLLNKKKYIGSEATVRYPNLTPDSIPRFGVVQTIFEGKRDL
jgi:DNA ligase-1